MPKTELAAVFSPITTTIWVKAGTGLDTVELVVKVADDEKELVAPPEQTVCTWNS